MSIRCAAKAVVVHEGKVLLNQNRDRQGELFYTLPGGGQNQYETIREAIVRECLEETGYTVVPEAFVGLYEEIDTDEVFRQKYPEYTHRVLHIYRCRLEKETPEEAVEWDKGQIGCVWVEADALSSIRLLPVVVAAQMQRLLHTQHPIDFGSHYVGE